MSNQSLKIISGFIVSAFTFSCVPSPPVTGPIVSSPSAMPSVSPVAPSATPTSPISTATPIAKPTPSPSLSPTPSSSPIPEPTPTPTPTPEPTPIPTVEPIPEPTLAPLAYQRLKVIAGNGESSKAESGINADTLGFPSTVSQLHVDAKSNIWLLDQSNGRLVYITPEEGATSNKDVKPFRLFWVKKSGLMTPTSFAIDDKNGFFYVVEQSQHRVLRFKVNPSNLDLEEQVVFAGTGAQGFNGEGIASETQLNQPTDVALDTQGNVYITDTGNHLLRKVTPDGKMITFAGKYVIDNKVGNGDNNNTDDDTTPTFLPVGETAGDGGFAREARLDTPTHVVANAQGEIFVSSKSNTIRRIKNDMIERFVGSGPAAVYNGDNIRADLAGLNNPTDLQIGPDGLLYFIDKGNRRIRRINPDNKIQDIAGSGQEREYIFSLVDLEKVDMLPGYFGFDSLGNFYLYDEAHRRVRLGELQEDNDD